MSTPPKSPSGARRGLVQRFTGKVGPLPVWAWALLILAAGYLVYRLTSGGSSSTDAAPADTTAQVTGDTGSPPASGMGGSVDNLNGAVLEQLTGIAGGVDALTGLVQSSPAFYGAGDSGSGSIVPNTAPAAAAATPVTVPTVTPSRPAPRPAAPATVRYYTFAPGKAPKGRTKDQAPAKGPAGTTLRFARGRGYYYA